MCRISIILKSTVVAACLGFAVLSATAPSAAARPANASPVNPPGPFVSKTPSNQPLRVMPRFNLPRLF